jgi:hypothetical protein
MARTRTSERLPPYIFYVCPGCEKRGSVTACEIGARYRRARSDLKGRRFRAT